MLKVTSILLRFLVRTHPFLAAELPHPACSSILCFVVYRPHGREDHTLESWARNKPEPADGPVGKAVRLKGADPPRVLARRYGQERCADERACAGWTERPVVPSRRKTGAY